MSLSRTAPESHLSIFVSVVLVVVKFLPIPASVSAAGGYRGFPKKRLEIDGAQYFHALRTCPGKSLSRKDVSRKRLSGIVIFPERRFPERRFPEKNFVSEF